MALSKLVLDDFEMTPTYLVGIHSNMEGYKLAFHLNRSLDLHLTRTDKDIEFCDKYGEEIHFPFFLFYNEKEDVQFTLIENKVSIEKPSNETSLDLFADLQTTSVEKKYLIPEESKVDFFFKIESDLLDSDEFDHWIPLIKKIPQIVTVRQIDYEGLKNKNNLIF